MFMYHMKSKTLCNYDNFTEGTWCHPRFGGIVGQRSQPENISQVHWIIICHIGPWKDS